MVLACAGDVPTMEACAASWLLQKHVPGIKVRVVNVVDLCALMSPDEHPHGMDNNRSMRCLPARWMWCLRFMAIAG